MKKIKIAFVGTRHPSPVDDVYKILCKHYDVEKTEPKDAEYILCSMFSPYYEYLRSDQIRIMISGENYIPDLNFVDYSISPYDIKYSDRCFYYPAFIGFSFGKIEEIINRNNTFTQNELNQKEYFANFIYRHDSYKKTRSNIFNKLSTYKRIESIGELLNNTDNKIRVKWTDGTKTPWQKKSKFSLCIESDKHGEFVTEKILDAFYTKTIPIYYGSDHVKDFFNEKAFINISDYDNLDQVIEAIKEIDNNDEKYLEMVNQPVFKDPDKIQLIKENLEKFVCNIIDQPYELAFRRSRFFTPKLNQEFIVELMDERIANSEPTFFEKVKWKLKSIFSRKK